jgi:hypothetical protein
MPFKANVRYTRKNKFKVIKSFISQSDEGGMSIVLRDRRIVLTAPIVPLSSPERDRVGHFAIILTNTHVYSQFLYK